MLTTGEMYPTARLLGDEIDATEMTGVEHLGQYVFEMTQAKVKMLKEGTGVLPPQEEKGVVDVDVDVDEEDDEGAGEAEVVEEETDADEEPQLS